MWRMWPKGFQAPRSTKLTRPPLTSDVSMKRLRHKASQKVNRCVCYNGFYNESVENWGREDKGLQSALNRLYHRPLKQSIDSLGKQFIGKKKNTLITASLICRTDVFCLVWIESLSYWSTVTSNHPLYDPFHTIAVLIASLSHWYLIDLNMRFFRLWEETKSLENMQQLHKRRSWPRSRTQILLFTRRLIHIPPQWEQGNPASLSY